MMPACGSRRHHDEQLVNGCGAVGTRYTVRRPKFWGEQSGQLNLAGTNDAAAALESRLPPSRPPTSKRRKQNGRAQVERVHADLERMRREGDWRDARPIHIVALYAWLHAQIYKVEPLDLYKDDAVAGATSACAKLLRDEFGGDCKLLVEFVAWCWVRERQRLNGNGRRLTWHLQFASRALLVDHRVMMAQQGRQVR